MTANGIELSGVGKRYWKVDEGHGLRALLPFSRSVRSELWSVRGVDLSVASGETVGILGRNGSGKTTLLRMLTGITRPSEGRVRVVGRVAPLIGVGVGFHAEMTGRENIHLNGLLLGLTPEEIEDRFDAIVAFSELESFIDTPVKFYSSGMFVRLGFAVAIHSEPEILVADEVLAVGDLTYQMKCVERMQALQEHGCTIVFVSHAVSAVLHLCPRSIVMDGGRKVFDGPSEEAVAKYHELLSEHEDDVELVRSGDARRATGGATITERSLSGPDGPGTFFQRGDPLEFAFQVSFSERVDHPLFGINVLGQDGRAAYGIHSPVGLEHRTFEAGSTAQVTVRLTNRLGGGTYRLTSAVTSQDGRDVLGEDRSGVLFFVEPVPHAYGAAELDGVVAVDGIDLVEHRSFRIGDGEPRR